MGKVLRKWKSEPCRNERENSKCKGPACKEARVAGAERMSREPARAGLCSEVRVGAVGGF